MFIIILYRTVKISNYLHTSKMVNHSHPSVIFTLLVTCCLVIAGLSGCSSTDHVTETAVQQEQKDHSELEALYWSRVDSSRMNFTQADVDFMTGMIGHHAQALIMSRLAPKNGASPSIQTLAARIINAQKDEIQSMQKWLSDRGQPVPEIHIDGLNLMIHGLEESGHNNHSAHDHQKMAGMLSQAQLEELAEAKGSEFDKLFLRYMIQHHEGAVTMVKTLFDSDGAALDDEAFRLAADINVDQITEIERMKQMLKSLSNS